MLQLACDDFDSLKLTAHMFLKLTKHKGTGSILTPSYSRNYISQEQKEEKACPLTRNGGDGIALLRTSKWRALNLPPALHFLFRPEITLHPQRRKLAGISTRAL